MIFCLDMLLFWYSTISIRSWPRQIRDRFLSPTLAWTQGTTIIQRTLGSLTSCQRSRRYTAIRRWSQVQARQFRTLYSPSHIRHLSEYQEFISGDCFIFLFVNFYRYLAIPFALCLRTPLCRLLSPLSLITSTLIMWDNMTRTNVMRCWTHCKYSVENMSS